MVEIAKKQNIYVFIYIYNVNGDMNLDNPQ